ncbi:MAG: cysteine desulfurase family protein [Pseudomonadota bacterium]
MTADRAYLDHNASAPLRPEARDAMLAVLDQTGNASSVHADGRAPRTTIEKARAQVAKLVGGSDKNTIFTSGATEAANMALSPLVKTALGDTVLKQLLVSKGEHPCVLSGGRFSPDAISMIPLLPNGEIDLAALSVKLDEIKEQGDPFLAAIMLVNNETGVIQPVQTAAGLVHDAGGYLLVDAVQAVGRVPVDINTLQADFMILSAHKIGGPQGAGALVLRDATVSPAPLIVGGGQEKSHRGGTENAAAIAGFGAAAEVAAQEIEKSEEISRLRDSIEDAVATISARSGNASPAPVVFGKAANRVANTTAFAVAGIPAETALISLDLDGVSISSGSACSSGSVKPSHVLAAMGVDEDLARCSVRISLGWSSTQDDVDRFAGAWEKMTNRLATRR